MKTQCRVQARLRGILHAKSVQFKFPSDFSLSHDCFLHRYDAIAAVG